MIYLDHAATTRLDPRVLDTMMPYLTDEYGNPSSLYALGQKSRYAVEQAREQIASVLECSSLEIIFTGSGTEANNVALFGLAQAYAHQGNHVIVSSIEHHSVLNAARKLQERGFEVTFLPADEYGLLDVDELKSAVRETTVLVSIMYANNEIGTIQPIKEMAALCKERGILFHTDACQAAGYLSVNTQFLGCDALSLNGSKIYGPKGVGVLYVREGVELEPLILGGSQEHKKRAGTEHVAGIVGMAAALLLVSEDRGKNTVFVKDLRDTLLESLQSNIPDMHLNGHADLRLPNNINLSIPGIEGESLILRLDMNGISASTGAACTTGSTEPSHVLAAIGLSSDLTYGSLRLTLGKDNTKEEIIEAAGVIPKVVDELRFVAEALD